MDEYIDITDLPTCNDNRHPEQLPLQMMKRSDQMNLFGEEWEEAKAHYVSLTTFA